MDSPKNMYEEDMYYHINEIQTKNTNKTKYKYPSFSPIPNHMLYEEDPTSPSKN